MEEKEDIERLIADTILDRPVTFKLKRRYFYVYQPSLGVKMIADEILKRLEFSDTLLQVNAQIELLRICSEFRDQVLRLIVLHTFKRRSDVLKEEKVLARIKQLQSLETPELSVLLLEIMKWRNYHTKFEKHIGLDKEKKQKERINAVKKDKSSIHLGGRSIYGSLLDYAAERYGWSLDYILWGVSANNLQMMLQDSVQSYYLTDKERKEAGVSTDGIVFNADDKSNQEAIKQYYLSKIAK